MTEQRSKKTRAPAEVDQLRQEVQSLRDQLDEANQTLSAIRGGAVDGAGG